MNLSFFIAKRYFFSKRKKNFINVISILSMGGVMITVAGLIIVLSVFNGLEDLLRSINSSFDPEIKIQAVKGKTFPVSDSLLIKIRSTPGVKVVTEVIEDYAYVRYRDADIVATVKGVGDNFTEQHRFDSHIDDGRRAVLRDSGINYAIIGRGIKYALSIPTGDDIDMLQIFYIKNLKAASTMDPSRVYSHRSILPGAVFSIEKSYDENYIFLPLDFLQDLSGYGSRRTSLEIKPTDSLAVKEVQGRLKKVLGKSFAVLTNDEQHEDLYKLLNMEKLFGFLAMSLLISLVSINIYFSLMMLTIDKKKDISIISAMGGSRSLILSIFLNEGILISFIGTGCGLFFGGLICWMQDHYGLVGMGMPNAVVSNYPVKLRLMDFIFTGLVMIIITLAVSVYPAIRASRAPSTDQL